MLRPSHTMALGGVPRTSCTSKAVVYSVYMLLLVILILRMLITVEPVDQQ